MLLVKTKIGLSKIHGIGCFAAQFIPKGAVFWKFQEGFDLKIEERELDKLSDPAKDQFLRYSYQNPTTGKYVLAFDDSRFCNHSDNPNVIESDEIFDEESIQIAARDIQDGEEITNDYRKFDSSKDTEEFAVL